MTLLDEALAGQPLSCPVVDVHVHWIGWPIGHCPCEATDMFAHMDRVGVDALCANDALNPDCAAANDEMARIQAEYPDRVVGVASLNPFAVDIAEETGRCLGPLGLKGLKLHSMYGGRPYSRQSVRSFAGWDKVYEIAAEHGAPILAHGVVTDDDIRNHPDTIFISAHSLCAHDRQKALADCGNFYLDTAWTQNKAGSVDRAAAIVGAERILWGTDAPLDDFAQRIGVVLDSEVSEEDKKKVLGGNSVRLFGIERLERSGENSANL